MEANSVAWLDVRELQRGHVLGNPIPEEEQDCSIRTDDLPEVVVAGAVSTPQCKPRFDLCESLPFEIKIAAFPAH